MTKRRRALIVGTQTATNGFESGASLRLASIKEIVENEGFEVEVTAISQSKLMMKSDWDLIVMVSYSTARLLRKARKRAANLWFDPTDSWSQTRLSLFRSGDLKQVLVLIRDLLFIWTAPRIDLTTFITKIDKQAEAWWWRFRNIPFVLPIHNLERKVIKSNNSRLVFVGDGTYLPNKKAIRFLKSTLKNLPSDIQIHLFGKDIEAKSPRFIIHGYVPANLLYFSDDIHLAPIKTGGGLQLKAAIPLWNGLNVIATLKSSRGLRMDSNLLIAENPKEYAKTIISLLSSHSRTKSLQPGTDIYECDEIQDVKAWLKGI